MTHRECATPQIAHLVETNVDSHPEWLPRYLPEGRGRNAQHVGVRHLAPPGAYAPIPCWNSREHWLTFIVPTALAVHADLVRAHKVHPDTFKRWARVKSAYAHSNGRQCIVRPITLASVLQVCERTIERCNALARAIGIEAVVLTGRMLTQEERWTAYNAGSRQRGLATEVALTTTAPIRQAVTHVTPHRGTYVLQKKYGRYDLPHGLTAERSEAAPRLHPQKGMLRARRRATPAYQLAQDVIQQVPWLTQERPNRLAGALTRLTNCPTPWTGTDIATWLTHRDKRLSQPPLTTDRIRTRPAAVLAALLRDIDPITDHPALNHGPLTPTTPPPVHAKTCKHPDCDGTGWLTTIHTTPDGYNTIIRCPNWPKP